MPQEMPAKPPKPSRSRPRRVRRVPAVLAAAVALALAGCGLLIPPQPLDDPLGVHGASVPVAPVGGVPDLGVDPPDCGDVADETTTHCAASADVPVGETDDIDDSGFGGIVRRVEAPVGIAPRIVATMPATLEAPAAIEVSHPRVELTISDAETDRTLRPPPFVPEEPAVATFELDAETCAVETFARTCDYVAADEEVEALDVPVAFHGEAKNELLAILTEGGANELRGGVAYRIEAVGGFDGPLLAEVTLDAPEGWVLF